MAAQYRADHVGSFLRPAELLEARKNAASDPANLRRLEDFHIQRAIARQKELGFDVATDGELWRRNFMSDFTDAVDGFDLGDSTARSSRMPLCRPKRVLGTYLKTDVEEGRFLFPLQDNIPFKLGSLSSDSSCDQCPAPLRFHEIQHEIFRICRLVWKVDACHESPQQSAHED